MYRLFGICLLFVAGCSLTRVPPRTAAPALKTSPPAVAQSNTRQSSPRQSSPRPFDGATAIVASSRDPSVVLAGHVDLSEAAKQEIDLSVEAESARTEPAPDTAVIAPLLTLDVAEQAALANHPLIAAAASRVDALQGRRVQVGLKPNPTVGYLAGDVNEEGTAGQHGAFLDQEIITANKLGLHQRVVDEEIQTALNELQLREQQVLNQVRWSFYGLLVAEQSQRIVTDLKQLADRSAAHARQLFEAKELSRAAVLQTEMASKRLAIIAQQVENDIQANRNRLAVVTGLQDITTAPIVGQSALDLAPIDLAAEQSRLLQDSPEIKRSLTEIERARWELRRQCAEQTPNLEYQASLSYHNVSDDVIGGLQIGMPLQRYNRNQGNIHQARAGVAAAQQDYENIRRRLEQEFALQAARYTNATIELQRYQKEVLPAAKEAYELSEAGFREGEVGYLDLLSAQQTYFDAHRDSLKALRVYWDTRVSITGFLLVPAEN